MTVVGERTLACGRHLTLKDETFFEMHSLTAVSRLASSCLNFLLWLFKSWNILQASKLNPATMQSVRRPTSEPRHADLQSRCP